MQQIALKSSLFQNVFKGKKGMQWRLMLPTIAG